MSNIRSMIDAARAGNAVEFENHFMNEARDRIATQLGVARQQSYRSLLGINQVQEQEEELENNDDA